MAFIVADRVRETSASIGTGDFNLVGAIVGYQSFSSAIGNGNTTYYAISNPGVNEWEVGIGTVNAGTLTRNTVLASSTGTSLVSFTVGSKDVFCTYPSEAAVFADNAVTLTNKTINLGSNTLVATSAQLASAVSDETGSGSLVFANSPTLTSPTLNTSAVVNYGTANQVQFLNGSKQLVGDADLTFDGTTLSATNITSSGSVTLSGGTANGVAYLSGSKVLTSGSALTFDGTNLGVGTASPASKLHVSSAGTSTSFEITNSSGNAFATMFGTDFYLDNASTGATIFRLGSGYSEQMRLTSTGLGIGTSSPGAKLDVQTAASRFRLSDTSGSQYFDTLNTAASAWYPFTHRASQFAWGINSGTGNLVLDSSGNLGLGVTPSAWGSTKAIDVGAVGGFYGDGSLLDYSTGMSMNAYRISDGSYKYKTDYASTLYRQLNGQHQWLTAPSGTAGNAISFTQAMTLDASGNLLVGVTSATYSAVNRGVVNIGGSSGGLLALLSGSNKSYMIQIGSDLLVENDTASGNIIFGTNLSSERMRIDSSGNLGLGVTPSAWIANRTSIAVKGSAVANFNYASATGESTYNSYWNSSGTPTYQNNGYAAIYEFNNSATGGFAWKLAPSGTAGSAISFTQAMTLTASGYLGVYTTSPDSFLHVEKTGTASLRVGFTGASQNFYDADIQFFRSGAGVERMRIDSSGNLLVGTTSSSANGKFVVKPASGYNGYVYYAGSDNQNGAVFLNAAGTQVGSIYCTSSGTAFNTSSDYRLKENVQPMQNALDVVQQLNPVTYTWKADGSDGQGFIAHELQAVVPDCVTGEKDAVDAEGNPVYQGIDTSFLVATLTKAIQEQQELINKLTARVAQLEQ